ncbi:MAG: DUF1428 domain-containing protein [Pseudomonadota bacterium]
MAYVDGFVAAVPTANKEAYRKHAAEAAVFFKRHGAVQIMECWGDDVPKGKLTDFYGAVQAKDDETVVFAWVVWPNRAARDAGNEKVFADMQAAGAEMSEMPFDGKRMIFGGFDGIVEV